MPPEDPNSMTLEDLLPSISMTLEDPNTHLYAPGGPQLYDPGGPPPGPPILLPL